MSVRSHKYGRKRQDDAGEDDDYVYDPEYTAYREAADRYNDTDSGDDDYDDGSDDDDDSDDTESEEEASEEEQGAKAGSSSTK